MRHGVSSARRFDRASSRHLLVSRRPRINPEHGTRGCHVHWQRQQGLATLVHASSISDEGVTRETPQQTTISTSPRRRPGVYKSRVNKLPTLAPNIYGSAAGNLPQVVTCLQFKILRWFLDFLKICVPLI